MAQNQKKEVKSLNMANDPLKQNRPYLGLEPLHITEEEFQRVVELVYRKTGIALRKNKQGLVISRLTRRLKALGISSFTQYLDFIDFDSSGEELQLLINCMTTNTSSFFREQTHFDFLHHYLNDLGIKDRNKLRIWSAACSGGQEPYSIAMTLLENIPNISSKDTRILATDISTKTIEKATSATYGKDEIMGIDPLLLMKYFYKEGEGKEVIYRAREELRKMVFPKVLSLLTEKYPFNGKFDIIFCRNVFIYFDLKIRQKVLSDFHHFLANDGFLVLGVTDAYLESRVLFSPYNSKYVGVYRRKA